MHISNIIIILKIFFQIFNFNISNAYFKYYYNLNFIIICIFKNNISLYFEICIWK